MTNNMCEKLPILLIAFNRLDTTKEVFEQIREYEPNKLYISIDGPRTDDERDKVTSVIEFIKRSTNWECEVHYKISEHNLGCKEACTSAIDWFFSREDSGVILEDDCVPCSSFFQFCSLALNIYKDDERVSIISGSRFSEPGDSVAFSKFQMIWGWASWANRWEKYRGTIEESKIDEFVKKVGFGIFDRLCWREIMYRLHRGEIPSAWDFQLLFWNVLNEKYSVVPPVNLVKNIGVGTDSTNNTAKSKVNFLPTYERNFKDSDFVAVEFDASADKNILANFFGFNMTKYLYKIVKLWKRNLVRKLS